MEARIEANIAPMSMADVREFCWNVYAFALNMSDYIEPCTFHLGFVHPAHDNGYICPGHFCFCFSVYSVMLITFILFLISEHGTLCCRFKFSITYLFIAFLSSS